MYVVHEHWNIYMKMSLPPENSIVRAELSTMGETLVSFSATESIISFYVSFVLFLGFIFVNLHSSSSKSYKPGDLQLSKPPRQMNSIIPTNFNHMERGTQAEHCPCLGLSLPTPIERHYFPWVLELHGKHHLFSETDQGF